MKSYVTAIAIALSAVTPASAKDNGLGFGFDKKENPQEYCLALNVYHEARGGNLADKAAVADVVLNRVKDTRYPNTICEVVHDGYKKGRRDCQFSWYCDGKDDTPLEVDAWHESMLIAWGMINWNQYRGISEGSTHYHAHYVNPYWAKSLDYVGRIGDHMYYRWK
jgi:N-acetylmuramoyl-L-alanine amidase